MRGERTIATPASRRAALKGEIVIRGARANNLKNVDVTIPLGTFTAGQMHVDLPNRRVVLTGRPRLHIVQGGIR